MPFGVSWLSFVCWLLQFPRSWELVPRCIGRLYRWAIFVFNKCLGKTSMFIETHSLRIWKTEDSLSEWQAPRIFNEYFEMKNFIDSLQGWITMWRPAITFVVRGSFQISKITRPSLKMRLKQNVKIDRRRGRTCNLLIRSQAPCHWASRPWLLKMAPLLS